MNEQEEATTCARQKPYTVHEVRSRLGQLCGQPAVTTDANGKPICAVHRGADTRAEQNRQRAKERYYLNLGYTATGKRLKTSS
jgi:hypothetical protein